MYLVFVNVSAMWSIRGFILSFIILHIAGLYFVRAMSEVTVDLKAPRFVEHHHTASLRCEHNVNPEHLYKVVFFKQGHRITQFVRGREPPFLIYNVTGAKINLEKVTPTSITLDRMDFSASGPYECEIALENPLYSKVSKVHEITVIVRQKHRPKIKIKKTKYYPGDVLVGTCQSAPAHPAPHLTWFINDIKVDESYTTPHGTISVQRRHHLPLTITNSSIQFPLSELYLRPNQTVEVSCVSTIPGFLHTYSKGFADIENSSISVSIIREEPAATQLPVKIISLLNQGSTVRQSTILKFTFHLLLLMYF